MPNYIRGNNEPDFLYTSGIGFFQVGGGAGTVLQSIIWEHNGAAGSGATVSILDTISGTAASGLWVGASGVRTISFNNPVFTSGMDGTGGNAKPIRVDYNIEMNSGLAVMISGGAANLIRAAILYISGQA